MSLIITFILIWIVNTLMSTTQPVQTVTTSYLSSSTASTINAKGKIVIFFSLYFSKKIRINRKLILYWCIS